MAIKNLTNLILKRLEEGTAEIWSRYQKMIAASGAEYDRKRKELDSDYTAAANRAAAEARIGLNNTLEKMADSGYVRSGETVHATLSANAARANALATLAAQRAKDRSALDVAETGAQAELSAGAQKEASQFQNEMLEALRDQENRDRAYEAQVQQRAYENRLAQERLELEKSVQSAKVAQETENKTVSSQKEEGLVPQKSAYTYLGEIVKRYTKKVSGKNYFTVNKTDVYKAVLEVLRDPNVSYQYRYELYLYAKSLGYIPKKS
ncbi:MAG: hypothetical protein IKJ74_02920 [Clostridia bacterium]|nr:hypothetical protein [Clostridia bacterium]